MPLPDQQVPGPAQVDGGLLQLHHPNQQVTAYCTLWETCVIRTSRSYSVLVGDGKADCLYGMDEAEDARRIVDLVGRPNWNRLLFRGYWKCRDGQNRSVTCTGVAGRDGPLFLHSYPAEVATEEDGGEQRCKSVPHTQFFAPNYGSYFFRDSLGSHWEARFWSCPEASTCVREGENCELGVKAADERDLACPAGFEEDHRACVVGGACTATCYRPKVNLRMVPPAPEEGASTLGVRCRTSGV